MLNNKVAFGALWLFSARFLSLTIGLIGSIIVANILGPEAVGIVAFAMSMTVLLSAAVDLPVAMALIQLKDPQKEDFDTAFTLSLIRGLIVCALILVAAYPMSLIGDQVGSDPHTFNLLLVLAFFPLLNCLKNPYFERKAKNMEFNFEFYMQLTAKIASFIASVGIAYYFKTYWAIAAGLLVMAGVQVLMTYIMVPTFPTFSLKSWKKLFSFSGWLGLAWFVNQLNWKADVMLIKQWLGASTLGNYHQGNQLTQETTQTIIQAVLRSLYSAFSSIQDDFERLRRGVLKAQSATFAIVTPIGFGMAATADMFMPLLLRGDEWNAAIIVVQLGAPITSIYTLYTPAQALAMALGKTKLVFYRDLLNFAVRFPMLIVGVLMWQLPGILIARAASSVVFALVNLGMIKQIH